MEKRFEDFQNNRIDLRALHVMVYDTDNVALALRQLSKSPGRMALGPDKTNIKTLEPYSIQELAEIVKDRLTNKRNGLCTENVHTEKQWEEAASWDLLHLG